jgi:homoserine dehydrogenase
MDIKIGLIGKGNVGTRFLEILQEKKKALKDNFNLSFKIIGIFEIDGALINEKGIDTEELVDLGVDFRQSPYWKKGIKAKELIKSLNIDVIIETTWTNPDTGEPALSHIIEALNNGIDVISSNKGPFYLEYNKIKKLAKEKNCIVKYEATVASCVPVLAIRDWLKNEITGIKAILNGTSNYILSRMSTEGISFDIALKEAQELGIAEADPTLDIEGYDTAGKIVILANELLGWSKTIKDVKIKGISKITPQSIELIKSDGLVIKHLAIAEDNEIIVEPRLIERSSPLNVSGTLNVIELNTKYAGPIVLLGRGAGGYEAASAILNDLINIAQNRKYKE